MSAKEKDAATEKDMPGDSTTGVISASEPLGWSKQQPLSFCFWACCCSFLWIGHIIIVALCGFFVVYIPMVSAPPTSAMASRLA